MKRILSTIFAVLIAVIMTVSVFADVALVPSIENKLAPEFLPAEEGSDAVAVIYDENGNKLMDVTWEALIVTPLAKADDCAYEDIRDNLKAAKEQIEVADTLADLNAHLEDIAKQIDPNYTAEDFIVTNLFDVSLVNEAGETLQLAEGNHVVVTMDLGLDDDDATPVIIHKAHSGEWLILQGNDIVRNADNTLSLTFYELCPVATLTLAADFSVDNPEVLSPQTGLTTLYIVCGVAVVAVMAAAILFIALKNKKRA